MADTLDLLTLAEAKSRLRIAGSDTSRDEELAAYITAVSKMLDEWVGPTVQRTVTDETHDGLTGYGCRRQRITLQRRPVVSVTTVLEYSGTSATTLSLKSTSSHPDNGYRLEPYAADPGLYSGVVVRTSGSHDWWWEPERNNVKVTYAAGRVASTTAVDARFKQAAGLVLKNLWREEEFSVGVEGEFDVPRQTFPTFAMPNAVKELLADELGQNDASSGGIA